MKQLEGFVEKDKETQVCKLKKSLYGLKQSQLKSMGFTQTKSDACIYVSTGEEIFNIAVYIDYILLATRTDKRMTEVKKKLLVNSK